MKMKYSEINLIKTSICQSTKDKVEISKNNINSLIQPESEIFNLKTPPEEIKKRKHIRLFIHKHLFSTARWCQEQLRRLTSLERESENESGIEEVVKWLDLY